ncbi:aspartate--tRNA ligase [Candidatus Cyrtobacter comes]|nr:aspartate--tRNA ligase [Candidatus Cyrtobacter comes]
MHRYRTHNCGQLTSADIGKGVKVSGWIHKRRDHGGVLFIDLRDSYGVTQLVTSQQEKGINYLATEDYDTILHASYESVICVSGKVVKRSDDTINNSIPTGEIEVVIEKFEVLSKAAPLPFNVNIEQNFPEDLRLKYRFLDLRRQQMHNNILLRNDIIKFIRTKMWEYGFSEFQTPILTASSPEGARDFLVPSRLHPGCFYALPQAPQQFKQLLMISGFDRYFQIAPAFRDEDARADRAPGEFYQLDIEMSFVEQEDVFSLIEPLMHSLFTKFSNYKVSDTPFPRIKYSDAMLKYGTDKPDLRNPIEISDVSHVFKDSGFSVFSEAIKKGACVRLIPAPGASALSRGFFDKMTLHAQKEFGAKGLAYVSFMQDGTAKGPVAKFLNQNQIDELKKISNVKNEDAMFFVCDREEYASKLSGLVRTKLGEELSIIEKNVYKFCWIVDFPFYEWNEDEKKIDFSHNPFSMPQGGISALINAKSDEEKLQISAFQYDIVCNGIELSSGAIRNHCLDTLYKAFELTGKDNEFVRTNFSGMVKALTYGVPPHGGIAPGVDRIVMLVANEPNIREVIAFPLNQNAKDLLMNAPSVVSEKQLKELHIKTLS